MRGLNRCVPVRSLSIFIVPPVSSAACVFSAYACLIRRKVIQTGGGDMQSVEPIRDKAIYYKIKSDLYKWNEKYYIMFLMGTLLALRVNEILKLRIGDVANKKTHTFRQSKTGKEITIAFSPELQKALKHYCTGKDPQEALIPARDNEYKPLSRCRAWEVLRDEGVLYGLNLGTHSMRKTCAYHYYNKTKDLATIKVWLNHSAERDTLTYIGVTQERVKQAMVTFKI